jgi:hypothetical protein
VLAIGMSGVEVMGTITTAVDASDMMGVDVVERTGEDLGSGL